jgi:hypothetical protein
VDNPEKKVILMIDRCTLPAGEWKTAGWEKRQVIDLEIQFVLDENPEGIWNAIEAVGCASQNCYAVWRRQLGKDFSLLLIWWLFLYLIFIN